jgi:LmbE family N-acetylglucosaminyl deacetylase
MHERLEEDRRAMESLECHASNLDLLDHQYRDEPADVQALVEAIRTELSREAEIWAPAALTRHPDHVAVRTAALALNERVVLYADLPHASARGWPPFVVDGGSAAVQDAWCAALAATAIPVESLHARVHRLADEEYASKIELVRFYASQIATLERDFGRAIDDPDLLGYEVEWELSCSEAARRNPSASARSATD